MTKTIVLDRRREHHRSSCGATATLAFALASVALLFPSSLRAQSITNNFNYTWINLVSSDATTLTSLLSDAGKIYSGITTVEQIAQVIGLLPSPPTAADVLEEMGLIANYQDTQNKEIYMQTWYGNLQSALNILKEDVLAEGGTSLPFTTVSGAISLQVDAGNALQNLLAPDSGCLNSPLFSTLAINGPGNAQAQYDWRIGMLPAIASVAGWVTVQVATVPNVYSNSAFIAELESIKSCLIQHQNQIQPPKPSNFCQIPIRGCQEMFCQDWRNPLWPTTPSTYAAPLCGQYPSTYASVAQYENLAAAGTAKIDHDDLPILFPLQQTIDTVNLLIASRPDLTATSGKIPFGANPTLCLANNMTLQSCSTGSGVTWTYNRGTGRIANVGSGQCLASAVPSTYNSTSLLMTPCTTTNNSSDDSQIWNWNTSTSKIKNRLGLTVTVMDASPVVGSVVSPAVGSVVSSQYESSWLLNGQVWTDGTSATCSGAICPAPGIAAWNQGTLASPFSEGYDERFPMDFNIFTYLQATGLLDVGGPVAANGVPFNASGSFVPGYTYTVGGISATGFSINYPALQPVAIVDGAGLGALSLSNGTIYNDVYYGPNATLSIGSSVNYIVGGSSAKEASSPINFEMAFVKLQQASQVLGNYATTGTNSVSNNTMTLTSTNPNAQMQVFEVFGGDPLLQASNNLTKIQFSGIPANATVLVNVYGDALYFNWGGFAGLPSGNRIIWNFPQATQIVINGEGFVGSILAPYADVQQNEGFVTGTVAAYSLEALWAEYHYSQFHDNYLIPTD
jgi:choice-of-anchor A domain-containing protein